MKPPSLVLIFTPRVLSNVLVCRATPHDRRILFHIHTASSPARTELLFYTNIAGHTADHHRLFSDPKSTFQPSLAMSATPLSFLGREIPDSQEHVSTLASSQEGRKSEDPDYHPTRASTPYPKQFKLVARSPIALQQPLQNSFISLWDSENNGDTEQGGPDSAQRFVVDNLTSSGQNYPTGRSTIDSTRHIAKYLKGARENVRRLIMEQEAKKALVSTRWRHPDIPRLTSVESGAVIGTQARSTSGTERITKASAEEQSIGRAGDRNQANRKHGIGVWPAEVNIPADQEN